MQRHGGGMVAGVCGEYLYHTLQFSKGFTRSFHLFCTTASEEKADVPWQQPWECREAKGLSQPGVGLGHGCQWN